MAENDFKDYTPTELVASPVSGNGDAEKNVRDATNGVSSATADSQLHGLNSYLNNLKNAVFPGATASEVGLNVNDGLPLQATLDGTNANITSASSGGAMNIKTTGSEDKKIKLGYGFSGYKTVQLKVNGQSQIEAQSQNLSAFGGGALSDNDIMWVISAFGMGETGNLRIYPMRMGRRT